MRLSKPRIAPLADAQTPKVRRALDSQVARTQASVVAVEQLAHDRAGVERLHEGVDEGQVRRRRRVRRRS